VTVVRRSLLRELLPPDVGVGEHWAGMGVEPLFPQESALVDGVGDRRRVTFHRGRHSARVALRDLGTTGAPVLHGRHGEPRWPGGVLGSITHCADYAAAVVSRTGPTRVLGVDAERDMPLASGILDLISSPVERAAMDRVDAEACTDRLLFSAKESIYKAWFPSTMRRLGFRDVELVLGSSRRFTCRPLVDASRLDGREFASFSGRWAVRDGVLVTVVSSASFTDAVDGAGDHVDTIRAMARGVPARL
jgi:4'-phosphopantetheinyl transferase EntD